MDRSSPSAAESLQELGRRINDAAVVSATGLRIAAILASYIDKVSEEVVSTYESEKENWLRNQSVARAARVRALLRNETVDVDSSEVILGYRLRQRHLGVVTWMAGAAGGGDSIGRLERAITEMAAGAHCDGRPIFIPQDEFSAWAWKTAVTRPPRNVSCCIRTRSSTGYARPRKDWGIPSAKTACTLSWPCSPASGSAPRYCGPLRSSLLAHDPRLWHRARVLA